MDRIRFAADVISALQNITSVLDVGCRDCALRDALPRSINYKGADLHQNARGSVDYVGDVVCMSFAQEFDCVAALDILEHVEDPNGLFDKLVGLAKRYLIVSLPNCFDLKNRLNFLLRGDLGGKYKFEPGVIRDRHRWIMNRSEIHEFYRTKASQLGLTYRVLDMRYGDPSSTNLTSKLRAMTRILPNNLCTSSVFGEFQKGPPT